MSEPQSGEPAVEEALQTFLDTIQDSKTFQEFVEAKEQLEADAEAAELHRTYQQKQQELQENVFDQSVMSELRDLQTEVSNDETIQRYQEAQQELIDLLNQTNNVISEQIGEEFAQSVGGGCC